MRKQLRYIYIHYVYIYIYDTSIFPFLGSLTETTSTVRLCALVKQSDQDRDVMRETLHRMADRMENLSRRVRRRGNGVVADQYMDYAMSYRNSV